MRNTLFIIIFCSNIIYSQEGTINITGKVFIDSIPTEAALVSILTSSKEYSVITDQNGIFNFKLLNDLKNKDSLKIKSSYFGYLPYENFVRLDNLQNIKFDIYLKNTIQLLDEVVVTGNVNQVTKEINKIAYKVDKRDYIKNTKAADVLNSVPSLAYNRINGISIDGIRDAKVYIDGLEASQNDLEILDVSDLDKVEVIDNPSARYGSEFSGGIVNVITRSDNEIFYKGSLELGNGLLQNATNIIPQFTVKGEKIIFKGYLNLRQNKQEINFDLERKTTNDNQRYSQNSFRIADTHQKSGNIDLKYDMSDKHTLFIKGTYNKNSTSGIFNGEYSNNSSNQIKFSNNTGDSFERFSINGVYERKIKTNLLNIMYQYSTYSKIDFYNLKDDLSVESSLYSKSKLNEQSAELLYEIPKIKNTEIKMSFGTKYLNRKFLFTNDTFSINQNVLSLFSDLSTPINNKISIFSSLFFEVTKNRNESLNQNFNNFLPSASINYKLNKKANLEFSFSKRINRPNSYDLNKNEILLNPGVIEKGNEKLLPQLFTRYAAKYGKSIKGRDYFSLTAYFEDTRNTILQSIIQEDDFLIYTKENIGSANKYGITLSYNTTLFDIIRTNLSTGFRYNKFKNENIINSGATFYANLFLSTNLFDDKVALTFFGSSNNPSYDFVSKTTSFPFTSFSISTNLFKDKLSLTTEYSDLFKLNSKTIRVIKNEYIYQNTRIISNYSNISIILSYNFGDSFNDRYKHKQLENNDIIH